jgi:diguanylate cyclase (GGDEF)-like protein/PAS domain S-box-containing protein
MDCSDEIARLERRLSREREARRQAEAIAEQGLRALYLNQQRAELLQRLSSAALDGSSLQIMLTLALAGLCDLCGWQLGHLFLVESGTLRSAEVWHGTNAAALDRMRQATGQMDPASPIHLPGRVAASAAPAWISIEGDGHFFRKDAALASGLRGAAGFPLLCRGDVIGVAEFFGPDAFAPDPSQADFVSLVLAKVGMAIERHRAQQDLQTAKAQLDAALANMSQGLCVFDAAGRITLCNTRFAELYGLGTDKLAGLELDELVARQLAAASCPEDGEAFHARRRQVSIARRPAYDIATLTDGRVIGIAQRPMPEGGWVETHDDITENRRIQARLTQLAHYDGLTGLPNRILFQDRIRQALARMQRDGSAIGLLCLDLDRFKEVNDTLGHKAGDDLLRQVAARLTACVRESDTVSRLGGDEFAILQTGDAQPTSAAALARRLIEVLSLPFDLHAHRMTVGASVGIALAPRDGADVDVLMRNADLAMYRAKGDGRGGYSFFEPAMHEAMQARVVLEADMRRGLSQDEFQPFYQPIIDTRTYRISGFEALLRWHHPQRGLVQPDAFIPLAEEIGLIGALGRVVLRRACQDAAGWPLPVNVAVNISPLQFRGRLLDEVQAALDESGLPPQRLELEITETVLLANSEATLDTLRALKAMGVRIAMDDFGTGYSSLSYLRQFPFDRVKIDRSFVKELGQRMDSAAIVRAVVNLCHSLGMATTAEGVETDWQLAEIASCIGVSVQGYLFGRPRPPGDVAGILAQAKYDVGSLGVTI